MTAVPHVLGGRYRLAEVLGQGGMSDVYRAVDERTGLAVAVKIVRSGDPEFARRLAQEARALERFEHPGLVRLLDTGVTGAQAYLVMELVKGSTLAQTLRGGRLTAAQTARIGATLAGALAYVHAQGIVHRDVKPANVLVTADGDARLGDFGVARLMDASTMTMAGTTLGTAAYMAPEQLEDHQVGPSADIWSLGIVLLECLTGRRLYQGNASEVMAKRLLGPVALPADLPTPWRLLLSGMLDHRPDRRLDGAEVATLLASPVFATAWEPSPTTVHEALTPPVLSDPAASAPLAASSATRVLVADDTRTGPGSVVPEPHRSHGRRWAFAFVAAVLLAGLGLSLFLAFRSGPASRRATPPTTTAAQLKATPPGRPTTTTTTTTTTTPTTTIPSGPTALATLTGDVASAEDAGTIDGDTGSAITDAADRALINAQEGRTRQAATQLQQAVTVASDGVQNGSISPGEGATVQSDLSTLAAALGVGETTTAPTIAPGPTAPGPGNGNGGGNH